MTVIKNDCRQKQMLGFPHRRNGSLVLQSSNLFEFRKLRFFVREFRAQMNTSQVRKIGLPLMNLVRFKGKSILQQLHLEEELLRTSSDNWCIINDGTSTPTVVMGMSGKPSELLELEPVIRDRVPVVKRFTGGGTVIVDSGTVFVSFICNKDDVPNVQPYPQPIMSWSSLLYKEVFRGIADFQLRENDYVFGNHKFGGNAQSITKNRWIHHTSFLWDFEVKNMAYLKQPARAPKYRLARHHTEFICRMKDYLPRSHFIEKTLTSIGNHFSVRPVELEATGTHSVTTFTHSTRILEKHELEEALVLQSENSPLEDLLTKIFMEAYLKPTKDSEKRHGQFGLVMSASHYRRTLEY